MTTARVRTIGGLPLAGQLDGSETIPAAQGGASVAITVEKLAAIAATKVPPGSATKESVGLGNADNTSDAQKAEAGPISDALATKPSRAEIGTFSGGKYIATPDELRVKGASGFALKTTVSNGGQNGLEIIQAAASVGPVLTPNGSDANIDLNFFPKGTGRSSFNGSVKASGRIDADFGIGAAEARIIGITRGGNFDLFGTYGLYGTATASVSGFSTDGQSGVAAGVRTSDLVSAGTGSLGGVSWAIQNHSSGQGNRGAWAHYAEARRYPSAVGYLQGAEIEVTNLDVDAPNHDPFDYAPAQAAFGLIVGAGGEAGAGVDIRDSNNVRLLPKAATVALAILGNTAQFRSGITFDATTIVGTDGRDNTSGLGNAINFAKGHVQYWWTKLGSSAAAKIFGFGSTAKSTAPPANLLYTDLGLELQDPTTGQPAFRARLPVGCQNGVAATGSVSGSPTLAASGPASNIDITFSSKGSGNVFFSNTVGYAYIDGSGVFQAPTGFKSSTAGFNGNAPIGKQTVNAAAADAASTQALVNQIRAALISYGLLQ